MEKSEKTVTSVIIKNGVTSIGDDAFKSCYKVTSVTIPNTVRRIGENSFFNLGRSVKRIGTLAFDRCILVTDIYCYADSVPYISVDAFNDVSRNARLWVPQNLLEQYKNAKVWGEFDVRAIGSEGTDIENTNATDTLNNIRKVIKNGQVHLLTPDGRKYTVTGADVR